MPRINSINFYQNRPKIKLFLPKKIKKFSSAGGSAPHTLCFRWLGALPPDPNCLQWLGDPPPDNHNAPPPPPLQSFGFGLHEEKFTARYCRPPFILAFGFKYAWNVWRRCSHLQTVYNTAKSISPGNTYTEKLSQKNLSSAPTLLWLWPDEVFSSWTLYALLKSSKGQNTAISFLCKIVELKTRFCLLKFLVPPLRKPHKSIFMKLDLF